MGVKTYISVALFSAVLAAANIVQAPAAYDYPTHYYPQMSGTVEGVSAAPYTKGGWQLSWHPVPGAEKYQVSVNGKKVLLTTGNTNVYLDDSVGYTPDEHPYPVFSVQPVKTDRNGVGKLYGTPSTAVGCSVYTLLSARGSGQNSPDRGWGESLGDRGQRIVNASRGKLGVGRSWLAGAGLDYPAVAVDNYTGWLSYPRSVAAGQMALLADLDQWSTVCTATTFLLFGYSQGADVIGGTWDRIDPKIKAKIGAVILFGDPHYNPKDTSAAPGTGADRQGPLGAREPFNDPKVRTWCSPTDAVCQRSEDNLEHLPERVHGSLYDRFQTDEANMLAAALLAHVDKSRR